MSFRPVLLAVLVACGGEAPDPNALPVAAPKAPQTTAPPVAPSHGANAAAATASGEAPHVGKALEVLEGGGYTYVKLGVGTAEVWIAGPKTAVKVGDAVTAPKGSPMTNFSSPTLNRTFPTIDFVRAIQVGTVAPPAAQPAGNEHAGAVSVDQTVGLQVEKAEGGHTVAELWANKDALVGKDVIVRAKVVKYTPGILNTNFMHIQDGTGDLVKKTHDLTVTTQATVRVGDVVVLRGKLAVNKDFGMGYTYPVLLEEALVATK